MAVVGTLPSNIQNGQLEDAVPVMANFNFLANQVNANAAPLATSAQTNAPNTFTAVQSGIASNTIAGFPISSQVQNDAFNWCTTTGSTANSIVLTNAIAPAGLVAGQFFDFVALFTNTGAVQANACALGLLNVLKINSGGLVALVANDIVIGGIYRIQYDGTQFQLINRGTYAQGADVASAATLVLDTTTGDYVHITGTTAITAITLAQGQQRTLVFTGVLLLTTSSTMILPGGAATITTAAGDTAIVRAEAAGVVRFVTYTTGASPLVITGAQPIRNTVLYGAVDALNTANFISAGSGLSYNIAATTVPVNMTFGAGYSNGGQQDFQTNLTASQTNQATLAANTTNYNHATYASSSSVTWGSTKAPPQEASVYDITRASLLQFGGAAGSTSFPDDFGNTWAAQGGAKIQTNNFVSGTGGLGGSGAANVLNGTTDFVQSSSFVVPPPNGWTMRAYVTPTVLPSGGQDMIIYGLTNTTYGGNPPGITLEIRGASGLFRLAVGAAAYGDIGFLDAAGAVVAGTRYYVEASFNEFDNTYRLYVNGLMKASLVSATRAATSLTTPGLVVGGMQNGGSYVSLIGYMDKFEYAPYCINPGGVAYTPPAAAPSISAAGYAQEWYDIDAGQFNAISAPSTVAGTPPTFTPERRIYHSEQDTNGTTVTATRKYAYRGVYDQVYSTTAVSTTKNHNVGVQPGRAFLYENGVLQNKTITMTRNAATYSAAAAQARLRVERGF